MPDADDPPRAVVVLVAGDLQIPLGAIGHRARCDLALLDDLLRLRLAFGRRGWTMQLTQVDRETRVLLELVGLGDCLDLRHARQAHASMRGGKPKSAKRSGYRKL